MSNNAVIWSPKDKSARSSENIFYKMEIVQSESFRLIILSLTSPLLYSSFVQSVPYSVQKRNSLFKTLVISALASSDLSTEFDPCLCSRPSNGNRLEGSAFRPCIFVRQDTLIYATQRPRPMRSQRCLFQPLILQCPCH